MIVHFWRWQPCHSQDEPHTVGQSRRAAVTNRLARLTDHPSGRMVSCWAIQPRLLAELDVDRIEKNRATFRAQSSATVAPSPWARALSRRWLLLTAMRAQWLIATGTWMP